MRSEDKTKLQTRQRTVLQSQCRCHAHPESCHCECSMRLRCEARSGACKRAPKWALALRRDLVVRNQPSNKNHGHSPQVCLDCPAKHI